MSATTLARRALMTLGIAALALTGNYVQGTAGYLDIGATGSTNGVFNVSGTATLAGTVNPNGAAPSAWFLYGTSSTLAGGTQTTSQSVGSGSTASNLTATLTGLTPGTKYYYQAQASNSGGTGSGVIDSFTTGSAGTTTGAYTVTVTGTDTNGVSQTTTFTLTVQ